MSVCLWTRSSILPHPPKPLYYIMSVSVFQLRLSVFRQQVSHLYKTVSSMKVQGLVEIKAPSAPNCLWISSLCVTCLRHHQIRFIWMWLICDSQHQSPVPCSGLVLDLTCKLVLCEIWLLLKRKYIYVLKSNNLWVITAHCSNND